MSSCQRNFNDRKLFDRNFEAYNLLKMKNLLKSLSILILAGVIATSCGRSVTRVSPDQQIDLSGRWNDTDSKLVAEEMIRDVLARPWRSDFYNAMNKKTCSHCWDSF